MKKISVIVPVYNASQVIQRCLESLSCQTLTNFEVIFINDCSSDSSLEMINTFFERNHRDDITIKIITHNVNRGVAAARNSGLEHAEGEFIYSLDSDDWIEPDALEVLYNEATTKDKDIVSCEWYLSFDHSEKHIKQYNVDSGKDLFQKFAYGAVRWNLWLFLIRKSIIDSTASQFIEGNNIGEDMMMMMKLSLITNKISIIHRPLYHYVQTNNNAISKNYKQSMNEVEKNVLAIEQFLHERGEEGLMNSILFLKLTLKRPFLMSSSNNDYKTWRSWFPDTSAKYKDNPYTSFRIKVLEWAAIYHVFFIIKLHYLILNHIVYGKIYK